MAESQQLFLHEYAKYKVLWQRKPCHGMNGYKRADIRCRISPRGSLYQWQEPNSWQCIHPLLTPYKPTDSDPFDA